MKKGTLVLGALALLGVGAIGIIEVSAAPQAQRNARRNNLANVPAIGSGGAAEGGVAGGTTQPDVTVSRIALSSSSNTNDIANYGIALVNGVNVRAYSLASTSCNIGNQAAQWITGGQNPVIAQNLYRYVDGKFEQIGMSWLKHSFCAVNEFTCGTCQSTPCSSLGIGCADTYWATLNGDNTDLGPRWNVNPQGLGPDGVHNDIYNLPVGPAVIKGRLQVKETDVIAGSQYVAEIHYLTHDEIYEKRYNNASYRKMNVTTTSMTAIGVGQPSVAFQKPGIEAWKEFDPEVQLSTGDDLSPAGRFNLGVRVYDNGDGTWDYEYALHNLNSHRGAQFFSVPALGAAVSNIGFHDVDYHSGDGHNYVTRDGTDWPGIVDASDYVTWQTTPYADNQNANALLWGTLYNFRFTTNSPPVAGNVNVGLWRPPTAAGTQPDVIQIATLVPEEILVPITCPGDTVDSKSFAPPGDGAIDAADLAYLLGQWGDNPGSTADVVSSDTFAPPPDGVVDAADLAYLLAEWGACE